MSLLEQLAGQAISSIFGKHEQQQSGNSSESMSQIAMGLLQSSGGIDGLLSKFKDSGLGEQAASWVGTGENQEISSENINKALGQDKIVELASKFGLSQEVVSGGLAKILPQIIDHATPQGSTEGSSNIINNLMNSWLNK